MNYLMLENIIPQIMLAASSLIILMVIIVKRNHKITNIISVVLLLVCALSVFAVKDGKPEANWLFASGGFDSFLNLIIILSAAIISILSYAYLEKYDINKEEFYALLILGTLGASSMAVANHLLSFLLGLELLSVCIYIMIAYLKIWENGIEAAVKYLILASVSSAFLIMGMGLIFAATGAMDFETIGKRIHELPSDSYYILTGGIALILAGAGFKMAVVPFHMWAPDVYQGAPAPAAAFIASVSKAAIIAVLLRFFISAGGYGSKNLLIILSVISIVSMFTGNILALMEENIKRILAYSSIAHFGYILVSFIAGGNLGTEAVAFYLLVYMISILGIFGMIILISREKTDAQNISDFRALFWKSPWKATILTAMLLSLAGIPATAGFIGKFYILSAGISGGYWYLALALILATVISLFYYLRIIAEMFKEPGSARHINFSIKKIYGGKIALSFLLVLIIGIGILPGILAKVIHSIVVAGSGF